MQPRREFGDGLAEAFGLGRSIECACGVEAPLGKRIAGRRATGSDTTSGAIVDIMPDGNVPLFDASG